MSGSGNKQAKIFIIGERPGKEEDKEGKPFMGESGQLLRRLLKSLKIDPEHDCFFSNATRCYVKDNPPPTKEEILACFPFLEAEIFEVKPEIIVLLGASALEAMFGTDEISKYNGFTIPYPKYNAILLPTFHPAAAIRNTETFQV